MKTKDFAYELPEELIAQYPVEPRDHSRLMVIDRESGQVTHRHFYDIIHYLDPGDALVVNETRVLPARLRGERSGGGVCEVLLLRQLGPKSWETLVRPGKKLQPGAVVRFGGGRLTGHILAPTAAGGRIVDFVCEGTMEAALDELGEMPLPPYIREKLQDKERYQTVYARQTGSAAAPTAGLHYTPQLLERIRAKGVDVVSVLLHVGLGTFRPVKAEDPKDHVMHSEYYQVTEAAAGINEARDRGGRIGDGNNQRAHPGIGGNREDRKGHLRLDRIFLSPRYRFAVVDALITNFHLPESTLVMLVSAFLGREKDPGRP